MSYDTPSIPTPNAPGLWRRYNHGTATFHHVVGVFGALYVQGIGMRLFDDAVPDNSFDPLPPPTLGVWWTLARDYGETSEPSSLPATTRLYVAVTGDGCAYSVRVWNGRKHACLADLHTGRGGRGGSIVAGAGTPEAAITAVSAKAGLGVVFVGLVMLRKGCPERAR